MHFKYMFFQFLILSVFSGVSFADDIKIEKDIPYFGGERAFEHSKLDIYYRTDKSLKPVIVFFHGGGWKSGDKSMYEKLGKTFAARNIVTVIPDYGLSPDVIYPENVYDVSAALKWVKDNIQQYGGDPNLIFPMGHSAGAHLVALVMLDPKYFTDVHMVNKDMAGAVLLSGVYDLSPERLKGEFLDNMIEQSFGNDKQVRSEASPVNHVSFDTPVLYVLYASLDYKILKDQAERLYKGLTREGAPVKKAVVRGRGHVTIISRVGNPGDKTTELIDEFVKFRSYD